MAVIIGIVVPSVIFSVAEKLHTHKSTEKALESTGLEDMHNLEPVRAKEDSVLVFQEDGQVKKLDMDTYLTGVLLGELPASFEDETLIAQAIVARTYAMKRKDMGTKHPQGAVCMNSSCCQAYCSPETYILKGGKQETVLRFRNAVWISKGMVLTYQGELIEATYFSCSGGRTEDAQAVWGTDVPYLQAVDSPGEEGASHYTDQIKMSAKEFASCLGVELTGTPASWFGNVTYTSGGGVETIVIGGVSYGGVELREKLNLYSTAFSFAAVGNNVHIFTRGFGHRVGMSQYGADAMAASGCGYQEILSHYYPGAILTNYLD